MNTAVDQSLVTVETPTPGGMNPATLLEIAVSKNADMATIERLMDLQDRWDAKQAKNAFTKAMAEFKNNPPEILKTRLVSYGEGNKKTTYFHADLGDVCSAIIGSMAAYGFSHNWELEQGQQITVTCVLTHELGHFTRTSLSSSPDTSGGKNSIQAIASAVTYLQRYTLLAATGLATSTMGDDDGRGADDNHIYGDQRGEEEMTPEQRKAAALERHKAAHKIAEGTHCESIKFIKERIAADDAKAVKTEWDLISESDQRALWLATKHGGCFTTEERDYIKTKLPRPEPQATESDLQLLTGAKQQ